MSFFSPKQSLGTEDLFTSNPLIPGPICLFRLLPYHKITIGLISIFPCSLVEYKYLKKNNSPGVTCPSKSQQSGSCLDIDNHCCCRISQPCTETLHRTGSSCMERLCAHFPEDGWLTMFHSFSTSFIPSLVTQLFQPFSSLPSFVSFSSDLCSWFHPWHPTQLNIFLRLFFSFFLLLTYDW